MSKPVKDVGAYERKPEAIEPGDAQREVTRHRAGARAWAPSTSYPVEAKRSTRDAKFRLVRSAALAAKPICRAPPEPLLLTYP